MHDAAQIASRRVYEGRVLITGCRPGKVSGRFRRRAGSHSSSGGQCRRTVLDDPRVADPRIVLLRQFDMRLVVWCTDPAGRLELGESLWIVRGASSKKRPVSRCH